MQIETCEICGQHFIAGYGYSILAQWTVTGHAYIPAFLCEDRPGGQHWGCCPEHAMQALINCLQSHMGTAKLAQKHQEQTDKGHARYADEHASWAKDKENFHIVEMKGAFTDGK